MTSQVQELRELIDTTSAEQLPPLTEMLCSAAMPDEVDAPLSIAEVAALVGVSAHTLRYYERIGLLRVDRDPSGYRAYDREAVGRIVFITRLRLSDMPIRDIQRYIALVYHGDESIPERRELLESHRENIRRQIADLQFSLAVVDYKITTYGGSCAP